MNAPIPEQQPKYAVPLEQLIAPHREGHQGSSIMRMHFDQTLKEQQMNTHPEASALLSIAKGKVHGLNHPISAVVYYLEQPEYSQFFGNLTDNESSKRYLLTEAAIFELQREMSVRATFQYRELGAGALDQLREIELNNYNKKIPELMKFIDDLAKEESPSIKSPEGQPSLPAPDVSKS